MEELISAGKAELLLPEVVVAEFQRNRERITKDSTQSLRAVLRRVKEAVSQHGDPKKKKVVLAELEDVNQKLPIKGGAAKVTLERIDKLFGNSVKLTTTDAIKSKAAQRALDGKAPFHRNQNSIGDAIIIETYASQIQRREAGTRYAFVTHNTRDFSATDKDFRQPHPDLKSLFSKVRSLYFVRLHDALKRIEPHTVNDLLFEHSYEQEPRGLTEILEALNLLLDQIWYNRHHVFLEKVQTGEIRLIEDGEPHTVGATVHRGIFESAKRSARRVEKKYGEALLGPWDDFDWGMLNGKLSALRWVLGDEWDMLDT